ncbi:MAG: hypothetical protein JRI59_04695 [Deltaproteobacteria bacterium]|nr:hypothetical protein [Deltaproteobacteria bacterium]
MAMVLGATDTGKSTLSRYLVYRVFAAGLPAALVDLDLGQSHLGPPTALGLGLFPPRFPGDDSLFPDALYFIGQTSPVGAVLEVTVGCRTLVDQALEQGVQHVVVNTSGLVHGPAALRLKVSQAELLRPAHLLALARGRELDALLDAMGTYNDAPAVRLPVSARVVRKTPEERRAYREARFRQYFARARRLDLPWDNLGWRGAPLGQGRPLQEAEVQRYREVLDIPAVWGEADGRRIILLVEEMAAAGPRPSPAENLVCVSWPSFAYRLVGLLDRRHRTLALGLILPSPWSGREIPVLTPLPADQSAEVRFLHMGKVRVHPQGGEML